MKDIWMRISAALWLFHMLLKYRNLDVIETLVRDDLRRVERGERPKWVK